MEMKRLYHARIKKKKKGKRKRKEWSKGRFEEGERELHKAATAVVSVLEYQKWVEGAGRVREGVANSFKKVGTNDTWTVILGGEGNPVRA
jgi:hypothetical protein